MSGAHLGKHSQARPGCRTYDYYVQWQLKIPRCAILPSVSEETVRNIYCAALLWLQLL